MRRLKRGNATAQPAGLAAEFDHQHLRPLGISTTRFGQTRWKGRQAIAPARPATRSLASAGRFAIDTKASADQDLLEQPLAVSVGRNQLPKW